MVYIKGNQMKTKWQWNLFYSKVIARSVNTFIPLGDETINSSLVERGRSLMNSQRHPLLHFLVRMKPTSTYVFLQVAKNMEITRGKIWALKRMLKCFPVKSRKFIPHQIGSIGTGIITQIEDSFQQHSRIFWFYGVFQHSPTPRNEPHLSALRGLTPFPMLDEHTLHYAHLQRNKENCEPVRFHHACSLSYRWQYRYISVANFARNSFHNWRRKILSWTGTWTQVSSFTC